MTQEKNKGNSGFKGWISDRFPVSTFWDDYLAKYYVPKNLNFWYLFGSFALLLLVIQMLTGISLTMNYTPTVEGAFASIQYIMRDVDYGWLIRHMHSTGASALFVVIYLHMFRSIIYGSYRSPRELVWIFGVLIYVLLMAEAFTGYLLPWGQMSYWGAAVVISLFESIPFIGQDLALWIRGDYVISDVTLGRFFALHVIALPLLFLGLVIFHVVSLHQVGSNNPEGIEIKDHKDDKGIPLDAVPFHPYFTVKDLLGIVVFLFVFCTLVFFFPEGGGLFIEAANHEPANPLQTPAHIVPAWYLTPFYTMLRIIPPIAESQFPSVIVVSAAIAVLFVLPWLDRSPVKSIRYKGRLSKLAMIAFTISFCLLGYLGVVTVTPARTIVAQLCTLVYFAFFFTMPFYTRLEKTKPVPKRVVK